MNDFAIYSNIVIIVIVALVIGMKIYIHWRQTGLKSGGAEWKFETYLVKFETYSVLRDYETKKTTGAPAPASLAPMLISKLLY